jgi:hypothetical protein
VIVTVTTRVVRRERDRGLGRAHPRSVRWARGLVGGLALLGLAGCAAVLDLDDYQDAVDRLCRCDQQLDFLPNCASLLSTRLDQASAATRSAWLDYFAGHCASGCEHAYDCFSQHPTCSERGTSCRDSLECCSPPADAGSARCLGELGATVCH